LSPKLEGDIHATGVDLRLPDARKRWLRNCDGETHSGFAVSWAPELRRCPKSVLTPEVWACVEWWRSWKDYGLLPYPGEMASQPAYVFEVIQECEVAVGEIRKEKMDEIENMPPPPVPPLRVR
jgi:hypothetical protein